MPDSEKFDRAPSDLKKRIEEMQKRLEELFIGSEKADKATSAQARDVIEQRVERAWDAFQKALEDVELARRRVQEIGIGMGILP